MAALPALHCVEFPFAVKAHSICDNKTGCGNALHCVEESLKTTSDDACNETFEQRAY
jgi:hypothetical protein